MTQQQLNRVAERPSRFPIRFPEANRKLDQDEEWCEVELDGRWKRIRLHDYHEVFDVPGLYEAIFCRRLKCSSPQRVVGLLDDVLSDFVQDMEDLRVLDVGAGNGMVGHELRTAGVEAVYGVDIIPEARSAALRDRPEVYADYCISDLTNPENPDYEVLRAAELNALVVVAALGYGDIPPAAFVQACNLIEEDGWLAFNIKETFLDEDEDDTGFCALIRRLCKEGHIQIQAYRRYQHRLSLGGQPLHYIAMVARKLRSIPMSVLD